MEPAVLRVGDGLLEFVPIHGCLVDQVDRHIGDGRHSFVVRRIEFDGDRMGILSGHDTYLGGCYQNAFSIRETGFERAAAHRFEPVRERSVRPANLL